VKKIQVDRLIAIFVPEALLIANLCQPIHRARFFNNLFSTEIKRSKGTVFEMNSNPIDNSFPLLILPIMAYDRRTLSSLSGIARLGLILFFALISFFQSESIAQNLPTGTVDSWGNQVIPYAERGTPFTKIAVGGLPIYYPNGGLHHLLALKSDGTVLGWGDNRSGQATVPPNLSGVIAIAAGRAHSLALKLDGSVVA
jgi:hypothetical protein